MLPIFDKQPSDWKDLQNKIGQIFSDMNYEVTVEKDIQTTRGTVNVDVYAEFGKSKPKEIKIAECKFWSSPVPKTIIHSFRTVISDFGANAGYIISKNGFQKGAFEAVGNSNVYLMDFNEFQNYFRENWLNSIIQRLQIVGRPLRKYSNPMSSLVDEELKSLSIEKKEKFRELSYKYNSISLYGVVAGYKNIITGELEIDDIEDIVERVVKSAFPKDVQVNCLSDYFYYLIKTFTIGVKEFDDLFGKQIRPD